MRTEELCAQYSHLREALEASYARKPWEATQIDRIAEDLLSLERTFIAKRIQVPLLRKVGHPDKSAR